MPLPDNVDPIQLSPDGGRLWATMFHASALDLRCNVFVYTPPGVVSGRRLAELPVLYLLHGMWGSEIDWPFKGNAQATLDAEINAGRVRPMLVAIPHDGLQAEGTCYADWHNGGGAFERYMVNDLRRFVEKELTGGMRPGGRRAIAGLSMGGYGSMMLSLRHPRLFRAAASMSGVPRTIGGVRRPTLGKRIFGPLSNNPTSYRRQYDPWTLVEDPARTRRLGLYLDCGRADFLLRMNRKFHARLERLGVEHVYHEYAGDHTWPSWRKRLPHALRFVSGHLDG